MSFINKKNLAMRLTLSGAILRTETAVCMFGGVPSSFLRIFIFGSDHRGSYIASMDAKQPADIAKLIRSSRSSADGLPSWLVQYEKTEADYDALLLKYASDSRWTLESLTPA